jgi:Cytidylate kinase-like family
MAYRAVALSQMDGAEGESIGLKVAQKLDFGYLNEGIVAQVANDRGVDEAAVAEAERRKSLLSRIADAAARGTVESAAAGPWPSSFDEGDKLLSLIQDAVKEAANRGRVVLVAHAASYACAERPDVLRVSITAPMPARVSRVAAAQGVSEKDATKSLRQSDTGRASYLKRVYGVSKEEPTDYDVVINTDRLSPDAAADLIATLVQAPPG